MRARAHITVFLSMVLLCVCSLMCGLLESARTAGARCYLRMAADSSLDSVMSQYHRELWDSYRLLFLEYGDEQDVSGTFQKYLEEYFGVESWYPMRHEKTDVKELLRATDDDGKYLEQEILDYMKYGVWKLDFAAEDAAGLQDHLKEAKAVQKVSSAHRASAIKAIYVEQVLEEIDNSLESQRELYERGISCLENCDGPGFRQTAGELLTELDRVPGLVKSYEEEADKLEGHVENIQKKLAERRNDITSENYDILAQEISRFEEYISKDGERRQEIAALPPSSRRNADLTKSAAEEALDVEREIEEWEGDDEDDELDEEAMWRPVLNHFSDFELSGLSFPHGIQDVEKSESLSWVRSKSMLDLSGLVLPEGAEIYGRVLDMTEFPSIRFSEKEGLDLAGPADKLLVNEYCGEFFTHFLSEEKKEVQYEMEYLLEGQNRDSTNFEHALTDMLALRLSMNLLHILADSGKREEAGALAGMIVGATGLGPMVPIVTFFIMEIWALGEAILDVRALLQGKKIALIKTGENWRLSLDKLLLMRSGDLPEDREGDGDGLGYESYLKLLLFLMDSREKYYRMMDVIQMNIRRKQQDFLMEFCAYQVDLKTAVCGKHVFFSLGFVENLTGGGDLSYTLTADVRKAY